MSVFIQKPLQERDLWQKLLGKRETENFLIELNNLLASKPLMQIRIEEVNKLCRRYKVGNISLYARRLTGLYHLYLQYCLEDRHLSAQEISELNHLKMLLGLSDRCVKQVHHSLSMAIYGQELEKAMSDNKIDNEEFNFLRELCHNLYLPEELSRRILEEKAGKKLTRNLLEIMSDKRISPEEEHDFNLLAVNLGFKPGLDELTEANFARYKLYWQIENGELPRVEAGMHLQPEEVCHFQAEVKWYEAENTANIKIPELEGRIRIPRGAFWRNDAENLSGISASDWREKDHGELLLTRKRFIFLGKMGRMVVFLENISGLIPYNDAVIVQRKKGKSPLIELSEEDADVFALMLNRLLGELSPETEEEK